MGTLMAVFAHPDDETFICGGTLAKAASEGHRVVLVCATKGEMGRRLGVPATANRETISSVREAELTQACQALRIADLHWLGLRDKTLEIQPLELLVQRVSAHMEREQPDTVVTFHELWGGHPDHCSIGRAATIAFSRYALTHPSAKLYFVAWARMVSDAPSFGLSKQDYTAVDVSQHLAAKLAAYRAHKTQSQLMEWVWQGRQDSLRRLGVTEYFISASNAPSSGGGKIIG